MGLSPIVKDNLWHNNKTYGRVRRGMLAICNLWISWQTFSWVLSSASFQESFRRQTFLLSSPPNFGRNLVWSSKSSSLLEQCVLDVTQTMLHCQNMCIVCYLIIRARSLPSVNNIDAKNCYALASASKNREKFRFHNIHSTRTLHSRKIITLVWWLKTVHKDILV